MWNIVVILSRLSVTVELLKLEEDRYEVWVRKFDRQTQKEIDRRRHWGSREVAISFVNSALTDVFGEPGPKLIRLDHGEVFKQWLDRTGHGAKYVPIVLKRREAHDFYDLYDHEAVNGPFGNIDAVIVNTQESISFYPFPIT